MAMKNELEFRAAVAAIFTGTYKDSSGAEFTAAEKLALKVVEVAMNPDSKHWIDAVRLLTDLQP